MDLVFICISRFKLAMAHPYHNFDFNFPHFSNESWVVFALVTDFYVIAYAKIPTSYLKNHYLAYDYVCASIQWRPDHPTTYDDSPSLAANSARRSPSWATSAVRCKPHKSSGSEIREEPSSKPLGPRKVRLLISAWKEYFPISKRRNSSVSERISKQLNQMLQSKIFPAFVLYSSAKQRLRIWKMNLKRSRIITTKAETIA